MTEIRVLSADTLHAPESRRLLAWLLERGADEFTVEVMAMQGTDAPVADAFEDALEPWALPVGRRRVVYRWTDRDGTREVRLWRLTAESLPLLERFLPEGIFGSPVLERGWFEDLAIYRQGELVLGVISHEREGYIRVEGDDVSALRALGIPVGAPAIAMSF